MINIEINNKKLIARYGSLLRGSSGNAVADLNDPLYSQFDIQINLIENMVRELNGNMHPNKFSHHVIALITGGSGKKIIGYHEFEIGLNMLMIIPSNIIHASENWSLNTKGYMLTFNEAIFNSINFPLSFLRLNSLFKLSQIPFVQITSEQSRIIKDSFTKLLTFQREKTKFSDEILLLSLAELIFHFKSIFETENIDNSNSYYLFDLFIEQVEKNFTLNKSVKFYADKLSVHPNHLNSIVKKQISISAKEYIGKRIAQEAEYLLKATKFSIKEISYQLGFTDTNHFSKFIKLLSGKTPTQIRNNNL